MPNRKGLLAPQNTFLDTIATRFDGTHSNFVLGNAKGKNFPIVYCSDGFCELTGYVRSMVMSKPCACEFLFGVDTSDGDKQKIASALSLQSELKTELILYRKNGAPFWCLLDLVPIKNEKGQVVLFLVSHKDVTREKVSALEPCVDTRQKLSFAVRSVANAAQQLATDSDDDAPEAADSAANSALDSEMDSRANDSGHTPVLSADGSVSASASAAPEDEPDELRPNKDYLQKRRRSRAVLYHLSGQFKSKSKSKLQLNHLQNFGQKPLPEYKVQDMRTQKFIIPHYGIMRIGWDWLILFCTFYIAFIVPFNAAFDMDEDIKEGRHMPITDIIIEVMFMVGTCLPEPEPEPELMSPVR